MKRWIACAALLAPGMWACGSDEAGDATGAPMAASAPAAAEAPRDAVLNGAPVIGEVTLGPSAPRPGEMVTAQVEATDPDGDPVTISYRWFVDGREMGDSARSFRVRDATKRSRIEVVAVASDGTSQSQEARASVGVGNLPPILQGVVIEPLGQVTAGHDVVASPRATDPEGDPIRFSFRWDVNEETIQGVDGDVLSASHLERGDQIVVTVIASDGQDSSDPLRSAPIPVVNSAPRITSAPGAIGDDGVFRYQIAVEDPDGDRGFRYRLLAAPQGMDLDIASGSVQWAPLENQAGAHPVKVEVADSEGAKITQSFVITVGFGDAEAPPAAQR